MGCTNYVKAIIVNVTVIKNMNIKLKLILSSRTKQDLKTMEKCEKCDMKFSSPERLERHNEKAHSKTSRSQIKRDTWN